MMTNRNEEQVGFVFGDLWHIAYETTTPSSNIQDHVRNIKKQMISLIILAETGGILVDKDLILTGET